MSESDVPLLVVEGLRTRIDTPAGGFDVVDDTSFTLRAGETMGIVGESGSGKSMTGLSLLGLVPKPAASVVGGRVLLDGVDLLEMPEAELRQVRGRQISMILQDPQTSLNPAFTIGNQLLEALQVHRRDRKSNLRERAVQALRQVRVAAPDQRIRNYPHQMSGGMRQRVVGAIAISCAPKVIIADEPTTSLDVTIQAQYLKLLKELQRETGLALIFITHDFGIVARICDHLMVMYAGRIVEVGPVRAIFNHPSHPYTRALLASVPTVDRKVDRLPSIEGQPPTLRDLPTGCRFAPRCAHAQVRCREDYPDRTPGLSGEDEHAANCWRMKELA